jgi:hypothetical protein
MSVIGTHQSIPTIPVPNVELMEEDQGVSEGMNQSGPWAVKKYLVNWNDRFIFAQAMAGSSTRSGGTGGAWIRAIPYPYPANPIIYAKEVTFQPRGAYIIGAVPAAWEYAVCTVTFGPLTWDALPSDDPFGLGSINPGEVIPFCSQKISYAYETYELPNSALTYLSDGAKFTSSSGIKVPIITMSLTFEKFPVIPFGIMKDFVGTVNQTSVLGCASETIFCDGGDTERQQSFVNTDPSEGYESNITQRFALVLRWRPISWQKFLRKDKIIWDVVEDSVGTFVYEETEFNDLIDLLTE